MPPKSQPDKNRWYRSWFVKSTLVLVLIAAFLGGIIWAGRWGLEHLRGRDRYQLLFGDIECDPPAVMTREKFLEQAQYYGRLPDRLDVSDESLSARLREGIAKHPWVEKVNEVEVKPPKRIIVNVTYRRPALAVRVGDKLRVVDSTGIVLPEDAPTLDLPIYEGEAKAPGAAGTRWGDPNVEAAARKVKK